MKKRYSLLLLALVALAALINWWLGDSGAPRTAKPLDGERRPDAYAEQFSIVSYDAQGYPRHRLQTPLMRHFDDETAEMEQPRMWQFNRDQPPWTISSEKALLREAEETVFLAGEVVIDRQGSTQSPPYHILTRDMTIQTATAYAETDQPVRIESQAHWITALGMRGWLQEPVRIQLQQEVRAYYETL